MMRGFRSLSIQSMFNNPMQAYIYREVWELNTDTILGFGVALSLWGFKAYKQNKKIEWWKKAEHKNREDITG